MTSAPSVFPKLDSFFKGAKNQSKRTEEKRRVRARTHCTEVSWELVQISCRVWCISDGPSPMVRAGRFDSRAPDILYWGPPTQQENDKNEGSGASIQKPYTSTPHRFRTAARVGTVTRKATGRVAAPEPPQEERINKVNLRTIGCLLQAN